MAVSYFFRLISSRQGCPNPSVTPLCCSKMCSLMSSGAHALHPSSTPRAGGDPRQAPRPDSKHRPSARYYTKVKNVRVPHTVPVPIPPPPRKVITHHVTVHTQAFDCSEGVNNWKSTWSGMHQRYCCYKEHVACSTKAGSHCYLLSYHYVLQYITVLIYIVQKRKERKRKQPFAMYLILIMSFIFWI